jgi:hypothetical protein
MPHFCGRSHITRERRQSEHDANFSVCTPDIPGPTPALLSPADSCTGYTASIPTGPTREQIASLAHSFWEARGCQGGSAEADWMRAEQELRRR